MAMRARSRDRAPSWMRDTVYPDVVISEESTWRDINDETLRPRPSGMKRLLMMLRGGHGRR